MKPPVGAEERNVWLQAALVAMRTMVSMNTPQCLEAAEVAARYADALLEEFRKRNRSHP